MNKHQYNQLSERLYREYCKAKQNNVASEFANTLLIDRKVVQLFDEMYTSECALGPILVRPIFNAFKDFFIQPVIEIPEDASLVERARLFAISRHRKVDQVYSENEANETPYEFHLWQANQKFHQYKFYIPVEEHEEVEAALWCHDCVEDTGITFNDLKKATNERVARIVTAVTTNVHGINRKERADDDYYKRIRSTHRAPLVKLIDRAANLSNLGKMVDGYRKEMPHFLASLGDEILQYPLLVEEIKTAVGLIEVRIS
jgi:hypothetical protein